MELSSVGSSSSTAGVSLSYGSARDRIKAKSEETELRSQLDTIYREVVKIRKALEEISNPLKLERSLHDTRQHAAAASASDLGLSNGPPADADRTLSSVARFSSVSSGTITVNGKAVAINVSADSLNDVIARVNASGSGATAVLLNSSQRVSVTSDSGDQSLVLSSGSTGFFTALNITDSTYESAWVRKSADEKNAMPKVRASRVADAIEDFARAINALFDDSRIEAEEDSSLESFLTTVRDDLKAAVQGGFDTSLTKMETDYGIIFDFGDSATHVFDFTGMDKLDFIRKLTEEGNDVNSLFFALSRKDDDGLIEKVLDALKSHEYFLKDIRGDSGVFVDLQA